MDDHRYLPAWARRARNWRTRINSWGRVSNTKAMLRAGGLFRPAMRPMMSLRRPQLMSMTVTRDYTVPRDETTTRVLNVVKAFDKV